MTRNTHRRDALARLVEGVRAHAPAAFSCSFGLEDMVLVDMIARNDLGIEIFTLDTGRLHEETHELMARTRSRYGREIRVLFPQADAIERLVQRDGPNGFRSSLQARKDCCAVRKVEPLGRALSGKALWITGLRRGQSVTRADIRVLAFDSGHGIWKLSPLADWSEEQVLGYLHDYDVPVNALHAKGYPSIGCAPCTRAVAPGEDPRAGRWWWEAPEHKECGLHPGPDGRLARSAAAAAQPSREDEVTETKPTTQTA